MLIKKTQQPVLRIDPEAINSPEVQDFVRVFRLRPGRTQYDTQSLPVHLPARRRREPRSGNALAAAGAVLRLHWH
jgi:hypothetical protein